MCCCCRTAFVSLGARSRRSGIQCSHDGSSDHEKNGSAKRPHKVPHGRDHAHLGPLDGSLGCYHRCL